MSDRASSLSPAICSGLIHSGVPTIRPVDVKCCVSRPITRAMPKSSSLTRSVRARVRPIITLSGLRSRCRMPSECAAASASAVWLTMSDARMWLMTFSRSMIAGQRLALDELHRQVDQPLRRFAEVVDTGDVRMRDLAGVFRLAVEAADRGGVLGEPRAHHLHRHLPLHPDVLGQVHLAHAALAELAIDQVTVGQERPRQRVGGVFQDQGRAIERAEAVVTFVPRPALRTELCAHLVAAGRPYDCDAFTGRS